MTAWPKTIWVTDAEAEDLDRRYQRVADLERQVRRLLSINGDAGVFNLGTARELDRERTEYVRLVRLYEERGRPPEP